jgi:ribosomal protein S18 acetylase RimI-like enzyme
LKEREKKRWLMKIRSLARKDKAALLSMLIKTKAFTSKEIDVAMELVDIVLKDKDQKDYKVHCSVNDQEKLVGYICYGPSPMTEGTFDLYWIAVDPECQKQGVGSRLVDYLEGEIRKVQGRMILADTASISEYEETRRFYLRTGFREVARITDYYYPGNDRITFCKRLV